MKMGKLIWNKQLSLISGPWHSIGSGISGRVLRAYYLTCPGRVFVPPLMLNMLEILDLYHVFELQVYYGTENVVTQHQMQ